MLSIAKHTHYQWASTSPEAIAQELHTDAQQGLTQEDVLRRIAQYGKNTIVPARKKSVFLELLRHFESPLIIILIVATVISFFVGEVVNALIILFILLTGSCIDYFEERSAGNAIEKLRQYVQNKTTVIRNGQQLEVLSEDLCVGDLIFLNAGRVVPADARIVTAKDLFINQSGLTGESYPAEKNTIMPAEPTDDLSALTNLVFTGTGVIAGTATAIVMATGVNTEFGKIGVRLADKKEATSFDTGMRRFGFLVMRITIGLVLCIFLVNAIYKHSVLESFLFALAVAVGLTPELLPVIMSVSMAKGSLRMAKKGVVVKRQAAIPNFGSMQVLCTDKTGTLTEDRIQLVRYVTPTGEASEKLFLLAYLNSFFQTGISNPLDEAILAYKRPGTIDEYKKADEIPFDFVRKKMSVAVAHAGIFTLICKGAPEEIFKCCVMDETTHTQSFLQYEALSRDGYRVLAIATRSLLQSTVSLEHEQELHLEGFVAFLDPPKKEVAETIQELKACGIEIKIITGDNHLVTTKVCTEIGLEIKGVIQGTELGMLSDEALRKRVLETTLFTRMTPDQKNRVIWALKASHYSVGYMGDGINDAPSLRAADIGISVDSATDIARDAADIILTRKDLRVLKDGIMEGRKTFVNTEKYILMGLSSNFGNMFSVAAATIFLPFLPMLPVQILANNLLYDLSQMAIPTDNVDIQQTFRPVNWNRKMIRNFMIIFGFTSSVFDMLTFYLLYRVFHVSPEAFRTGWFIESLATQILVVYIIRTRDNIFNNNPPSTALVASTLACLLAGLLLIFLPLGRLLGFTSLSLSVISAIAGLVIAYLVTAEGVKHLVYRFFTKSIGR